MIEWEIWDTTTECISIITAYDPIIYDLYINDKNLLLTVLSTLMLECTGDTLNYLLIKYEKDLIYASFHEPNNNNFGHLVYGIFTLEQNKVHVQIYKKSKNYILDYILDLLYLDSTKDNVREKWE